RSVTGPASDIADDDREEAIRIAMALRAHLEWHAAIGTEGLPTATSATSATGVTHSPPAHSASMASASTHSASIAEPPRGAKPIEQGSRASGTDPANTERRIHLANLAEVVAGCEKCGLCRTRTQTVFARGNPEAELCFVGEGPGADEDAQ